MNTLPFQLRLADACAMPWKNGGGVTRELLAWPNALDWSIRVSVADIERDGPFSSFPGVDRFFAVLEGEGVELEGVGVVRKGDAPVKFHGETARGCRLINGKTRDLNVMIRRDCGYGALHASAADSEILIAPGAVVHGAFTWPAGFLSCDVGDKPLLPERSTEAHVGARVFHFAFWNHNAEEV